MKTDELIDLLVSEAQPIDRHAHAKRMALMMAAGAGAATLGAGWGLGWRTYSAQELQQVMVWWRWAFCLGVAGVCLLAFNRLARPGQRWQALWPFLAVPFGAMACLATGELLSAPPAQRAELLMGSSALECPWNIALLAVPAWVAGFWVMKQMAPAQPAWAGAAVGMMAGAIGALGYTAHCTELTASFIAVWYSLGILIPAAVGAVAGPRLLRW